MSRTLQRGLLCAFICLAATSVANAQSPATPITAATATAASRHLNLLTEVRDAPARGFAQPQQGAFTLDLHDGSQLQDNETLIYGSLLREIARQAVLIAARDGLGLATRDRSLREPIDWTTPGKEQAWPLSVMTTATADWKTLVTVLRHHGDDWDVLWEREFDLSGGDPYVELTAAMEPLARGELVDLLRNDGHQGAENRFAANAPVPPEVLQQLEDITFIPQFFLVQDLHALLRASGESPARLAALARAYAQLAVLCDLYPAPIHKVYRARALLYAQRAVERDPSSAASLWNRALVRGLVGLPAAAGADVQAARMQVTTEAPAWAAALEAYCRGDMPPLRIEAQRGDPLAALLYAQHAMYRVDREEWLEAVQFVLEASPDSVYGMLHFARLGSLGARASSNLAIDRLPSIIGRGLNGHANDLPADIQLRLRSPSSISLDDIPIVSAALRDVSLPNAEPSLAVLGQMIDEATFQVIYRLIDYYRAGLGTDVRDRVESLLPLVASHPYHEYFAALASRQQFGRQPGSLADHLRQLMDEMDLTEVEPITSRLMLMQATGASQRYPLIRAVEFAHTDRITYDLAFRLQDYADDNQPHRPDLAAALRQVAPNWPLAVEWQLVITYATISDEELAELAQRYHDDPAVLRSLFRVYKYLDRLDEARDTVDRWIELRPSYDAYVSLSQLYTMVGDLDGWVQALETSMDFPTQGLEHATQAMAVSSYYRVIDRPDLAAPYAQRAAGSGAGWALIELAEVEQMLGNLDQASALRRTNASRYPGWDSIFTNWLSWSLQNDVGDVDHAMREFADWLQRVGDAVPEDWGRQVAVYLLMNGEPERALEMFRARTDDNSHWRDRLHVAIIADSLDEPAVRDQYLQLTLDDPYVGWYDGTDRKLAIVRKLQEHFADNDFSDFDSDWFNQQLARLWHGETSDMCYYLSQVLLKHGHEELGLQYLRRAASTPDDERLARLLALFALRQIDEPYSPPRPFEYIASGVEPATHFSIALRHQRPLVKANYLPDGNVLTVDSDSNVSIWNPATAQLLEERAGLAAGSQVSRDGNGWTIVNGSHSAARVLRTQPDEEVIEVRGPGGWTSVSEFAGNDARRILQFGARYNLSANPQYRLQVWDLDDGLTIWQQELGSDLTGLIRQNVAENSVLIVQRIAGANDRLTRYSLADGSLLGTAESPRPNLVGAAFSTDGSIAITWPSVGPFIRWDLRDMRIRAQIPHNALPSRARGVAISPDNRLLAIACTSGTLVLMDLTTGAIRARALEHDQEIPSVEFSTDGRQILTASGDLTARLWDVETLLREAAVVE